MMMQITHTDMPVRWDNKPNSCAALYVFECSKEGEFRK